jgi:hypothetical protein
MISLSLLYHSRIFAGENRQGTTLTLKGLTTYIFDTSDDGGLISQFGRLCKIARLMIAIIFQPHLYASRPTIS